MNNFFVIFCREFIETVRSRFFAVTTVMFAVITLLLLGGVVALEGLSEPSAPEVVPDEQVAVMPDQSEQLYRYRIAVADASDGLLMERVRQKTPTVEYVPCRADDSGVLESFADGADACVFIDQTEKIVYYVNPERFEERLPELFSAAVNYSAREIALERLGLSPADAAAVLDMSVTISLGVVSESDEGWVQSGGGADIGDYLYGLVDGSTETGSSISVYLISTLLFMAISFYGQMVASRVSQEKSTRMIEVLSTAASPAELLCGKVLGVGAAGLAQVSLFFAVVLIIVWSAAGRIAELSPYLGGLLSDVASSAASSAWAGLSFYVLGFLLLAFIYGGLGAMASTTEGISGFAALPLQLPMLGYFLAMLAPATGPSAVLTVCSYFPLFSPFVMLARMNVELVAWWQVALSLLILAASVAGTAVLSARLYRRGMLRYGQPPKLRELIAAMKK